MTDKDIEGSFLEWLKTRGLYDQDSIPHTTSSTYMYMGHDPYIKEFNFDEVVEETITSLRHTLLTKSKEYQRNGNVFHNFDKGADFTGSEPEDVLWGFCLKHVISIDDLVGDLYDTDKEISLAQVKEKIRDIQVYLCLLEGLFTRRLKG